MRGSRLARLRARFETWRQEVGGRGGRGKPIPEELWSEAVEVARSEGTGATARALRLNSGRLAARMRTPLTESSGSVNEFVELDVGELGRSSRTRAQVVLRFVGADGDQFEIDVLDTSAVNVVDVVRAFRGRRE